MPTRKKRVIVGLLATALILAAACSRHDQSREVPKTPESAAVPPVDREHSTGHPVETPRLPAQHRKLPEFSDYPAGPLFAGRPAVPILATRLQRMFKSHFRFGVHEQPNFAGQYKIVEWGCGSPCLRFAIADLKTGAVYDPPFDSVGPDFSQPGRTNSDWGLIYRVDSRLLVAQGCPEDPCGTYYYEWVGKRFKLIRAVPNEPRDEDEDNATESN